MKIIPNLRVILNGVIMGIAEIVPGVSASTATLILGIYDDFINLLNRGTNFLRELVLFVIGKSSKKELTDSFKAINILFGIELFLGMSIGIVLFSNIVDYFYTSQEAYLKAIFFGIILASLIIPIKVVKKVTMADVIALIVGFLAFYLVLNIHPANDPSNIPLWLVFIGGAISVSGMVLPGVNSSFLLIPLGIYELILHLVSEFSKLNFSSELIIQAIVFGLGLLFGLVSIVKLLKYAFEKHVDVLLSLIAGIMLASLIGIWPFKETPEIETNVAIVILLIIVSTLLTLLFISKSKPEKEFRK